MIKLNKVGIDIDGTVYQFYKLNFAFERRLIAIQDKLNRMHVDLANKYSIEPSEVDDSDKISVDDKLQLAKTALELQDTTAELFVNSEESKILDKFDADAINQLISALR